MKDGDQRNCQRGDPPAVPTGTMTADTQSCVHCLNQQAANRASPVDFQAACASLPGVSDVIPAHSDNAKLRILAAAESLYSRRAIESVSLREIGRIAGHRNTNAVQHHFTDREGLVQAIFAWRVAEMEAPRQALLDEIVQRGDKPDVPGLLRVLCQPILDLKDEQGRHTYAGFMSQYLLHHRPAGMTHASDTRPDISAVLNSIQRQMFEALRIDSPAMFNFRIVSAYLMVMNAIVLCDTEPQFANKPELIPTRFEEALAMASAALVATIGK